MSIVRIQHDKEKPYVQINKIGLETPNVSWAAKGLWAYLISRPDNWRVSVAHLSKIYAGNKRGNGEEGVRSALDELMDEGYVFREKTRGKEGQFGGMNYVVFESKQHPKREKVLKKKVPRPVKPDVVQPDPVKTALIKNEFIHSLESEECSLPISEKTEANSDKESEREDRNSPLLNIKEAMRFCQQMNLSIQEKDFKIWSAKFTSEEIFAALRLALDHQGSFSDDKSLKQPIKNHAAFVNAALNQKWTKEREKIEINRNFAIYAKKETRWDSLIITKQYCKDERRGIDWSFKRDPDSFKRDFEGFIRKTIEAERTKTGNGGCPNRMIQQMLV